MAQSDINILVSCKGIGFIYLVFMLGQDRSVALMSKDGGIQLVCPDGALVSPDAA
jgi:hypothetical protein